MATRIKTIEIPFTTYTSLLTGDTRYAFPQITAYLPENSSRVFRSVVVEIAWRSAEEASTSYTDIEIGVKLGAAAWDYYEFPDSNYSASGRPNWPCWRRDVTSYFTTNFGSGTSQTSQVSFKGSTFDTNNITAKLIITYEYDDSAQTTRIRTVRIPLESPVNALTNVLAEIGTNQVPNLDDLLPEASKVYRAIWFEIAGAENPSALVDCQLGLELDSEGEELSGNLETFIAHSANLRYIWNQDGMATDSTHAFKARATVTRRVLFASILLCVTYEYNHSTSTSIMNSVMLVLNKDATYLRRNIAPTGSGYAQRFQQKVFIEEASVSLKQSGAYARFTYADIADGKEIYARIGGQSYRTYNVNASGSFSTEQMTLMQRLDSGSAQGAGLTLTRGENALTFDIYTDSVNVNRLYSPICVVVYLNYTSSKHADGDGVHNHTVFKSLFDIKYDQPRSTTDSDLALDIPETDWFINSLGVQPWLWTGDRSGIVTVEIDSGEAEGAGWRQLGIFDLSFLGSDMHTAESIFEARDRFMRYAQDPDSERLGPKTVRRWEVASRGYAYIALYLWYTYHSITFDVAGTVSNYAGDGSGVLVEAHRSDTDEKIGSDTTAVGGAYSIPWYDDTIDVYAQARENATHTGRSDDGKAS